MDDFVQLRQNCQQRHYVESDRMNKVEKAVNSLIDPMINPFSGSLCILSQMI